MALDFEIKRLLRAARRFWWIPAILVLVFAPTAWALGRLSPDMYVARSQLLVTPISMGSGAIASQESSTETYRQMVKSSPVLDAVILELDLDLTWQELALKIETHRVQGTSIIEIQVRDEDPQVATDINNAVARQVEAEVSDLTNGQMQRNLDDLNYEAQSLRDRITTLDTRLSTIDTEENSEDSAIQSEITSIRSERLQLQQTLVDIESSIRSLTSDIARTTSPLAVLGNAVVPSNPEGTSAIVLAALGAIAAIGAGGLIGIWLEYRNRTIWDAQQVVSGPVLSTTLSADGADNLVARLIGAFQNTDASRLAIVSADEQPYVETLQQQLATEGIDAIAASNVLTDGDALRRLQAGDAAVIVARLNSTHIADLQEVAEVARLVGVRPIGTVLVQS